MSQDPQTAAEWQEAVDAANFFLIVDSCRQYGLITGGPDVDQERCSDILTRGAALGYQPAPIDELCRKFFKGNISTPRS